MSASGSAAPPGSPAPVTLIKLARSPHPAGHQYSCRGVPEPGLPLPDGPEEMKQPQPRGTGADPGVAALQAVPEHPPPQPQA